MKQENVNPNNLATHWRAFYVSVGIDVTLTEAYAPHYIFGKIIYRQQKSYFLMC
jgi:hypothetical protein